MNDLTMDGTRHTEIEGLGKTLGALRDAAAYLAPNGGYTRVTIQTEGGSGAKAWTLTLTYVEGSARPFVAYGQTLVGSIAAMGVKLLECLREREEEQRRVGENVRACLARAAL